METVSAPWAEGDMPVASKEAFFSFLMNPSFAIALGMTDTSSHTSGSDLLYFKICITKELYYQTLQFLYFFNSI